MPNVFDLNGRVALVTGASSGIGAQLSRSLARSGAAVVMGARRKERLDELQAEIESSGGKCHAVQLDVAEEASIIAAYDAAEQAFGPIDTVIANAGVMASGLATELPVEQFDNCFSINVRGVWLTAREGARRMIANGSPEKQNGRILLVSSVGAKHTSPVSSIYGSSKAAVSHMSRNLAFEWVNQGINVNAVLPGLFGTEMTSIVHDSEVGRQFLAHLPRPRVMDVSELDDAVLLLCSEGGKSMTGIEMIVDNGQLLA